ncbi:nitronate monooxygenase [Jeotgalicoccus coquinae]|uniref:Probable nitronate monooxygenase n=1 Tax=Jeotgalicoccus coquinae TaxID=709509 RepID=A0A6V7R9Y6_9STAP|nr:nitronate monooxygenase [Jeotgalicoccus coquinae]MBB6422755.1 nitronate monooxygenase [Jeotgalicoccus coquinae]GGE13362.1 nitronate monooxygenase [Jeotgalicoccus coquinae]CAD2074347.1 Nitronate monooxygenase [Jeotgalicoccus coquinae]
MKLNAELCSLLNIKYPIIQAGMAGGSTTPELIANVSNAGGLGTLGAAYMKPEDIKQAVGDIRKLTDKPFAVNLFCVENGNVLNDETRDKVKEELLRIGKSLGISERDIQFNAAAYFEEQFKVLIEENVPVISTAFGLLPEDKVREAKENGRIITSMITTVDEAILAEKNGADIIIAQGADAGGHRGTFDLTKYENGADVGTFSLVPQVADNVSIPVVAAGGANDGRSLVAALALGASGVQIGTRFLSSEESGIHKAYKQKLFNSHEDDTVITKVFSGRPARGILNKFIEEFSMEPLAYPYQNSATKSIRGAAAKHGDGEFMSLWSGQNLRPVVKEQSAAEIVEEIMEKAQEILG